MALDVTGCYAGGGFINTSSNRFVFIAKPDPDTIDIEDIAYALSRIARYGGHADPEVNVAQHSCMVHDYLLEEIGQSSYSGEAKNRWPLSGLMHDAEEAYTGDMPRPLKKLFPEFVAIAENLRKIIFTKYDCPDNEDVWHRIKHYDNIVLRIEAANVMPTCGDDWNFSPEVELYRDTPYSVWSSEYAEAEFLKRFRSYSMPSFTKVGAANGSA